jgi:hypothetical protein
MLETKYEFHVKMDSDVHNSDICDSFIGSN